MNSRTARSGCVEVVVIGAGYAGTIATNRFLASLTEDERRSTKLTLVNPRSVFVERVRLHELAAGARDTVTVPLAQVLHPDATVLVGRACMIDPDAKTVRVATGSAEVDVDYDYLVYALGSVAADHVPGAARNAFLMGDYEAAAAAAKAISKIPANSRIAVVGGGFTGVEAASEIAEQHPDADVCLYCSGPLVAGMRPAARRSLRRSLRGLGIAVEEDTTVTRIEAGLLELESGGIRTFDMCIFAGSFAVPDLAAVSGLPVDERGRLRVDEHLRCVGMPAVIGAGDAIVAPDAVASHLRMGCAAALPLGAHAADTLLASIRGTAAPRLSIGYVVQCISLGRKKAYIQVVRRDDTPRAMHSGGRVGAKIKEKICTMVVDIAVKEATKPGTYQWRSGPEGMPSR